MDVSTFTTYRQSLSTPAGEIAYTELGSGPVALFVHGLGTSGVLWRHVIEDLRDTSRCIAIDLPLHGGSPARDDMSVTALAQAVADLCDGLGLGQVDLVGNDTGGAVAQIFAARHAAGGPTRFTLTNCDCEGILPAPSSPARVRPGGPRGVASYLTPIGGPSSSLGTSSGSSPRSSRTSGRDRQPLRALNAPTQLVVAEPGTGVRRSGFTAGHNPWCAGGHRGRRRGPSDRPSVPATWSLTCASAVTGERHAAAH